MQKTHPRSQLWTLRCSCGAAEHTRQRRYLDILENSEAKVMRFYKRMEPATVVPRMIPSEKLDGLVQPSDRSAASPLDPKP